MKWIAKDGKLFSTRDKAEKYEIKIGLREPITLKQRVFKNLNLPTPIPINQVIPEVTKFGIYGNKLKEKRVKKIKKFDPNKDKYYVYLKRSNDKNFEFDFTRDEFYALIELPCYYCNGKSTGLDRIDSSKGYTWLNTEPCCYTCNMMKHVHAQNKFYDQIIRIYNNKMLYNHNKDHIFNNEN